MEESTRVLIAVLIFAGVSMIGMTWLASRMIRLIAGMAGASWRAADRRRRDLLDDRQRSAELAAAKNRDNVINWHAQERATRMSLEKTLESEAIKHEQVAPRETAPSHDERNAKSDVAMDPDAAAYT